MMTRFMLLALIAFAMACAPVIAETTSTAPSSHVSGSGGANGSPNSVKTIFDYKSELRLSDDQEQRMRQILVELNKALQVERAKLTILSYDLEDMVRKEADLDQIKKALQQEADMRASIAYADLVAGRQINSTLTPDQLTKWRQIQASARQAVASAVEVNAEKKEKSKKK